MRSGSKSMALCGVLAALAVVIMMMGGLIPVATYVCPMLCCLVLLLVLNLCGKRMAWAWFGAVSFLSLLLGPDKEAAAVFLALGHYPIVKPRLDQTRFKILWKLILFNATAGILYAALMYVFGMSQLISEFQELGLVGLCVTLILGNVSFLLLDKLLDRLHIVLKKKLRYKQS